MGGADRLKLAVSAAILLIVFSSVTAIRFIGASNVSNAYSLLVWLVGVSVLLLVTSLYLRALKTRRA